MELKEGYKQTEIGQFPVDWEVNQLGELSVFVTSGSRGWARFYSDQGALFVRSQNIRDGRLNLTDRQCVDPPRGSEGNRTQLRRNDLLITITGNSVGNVGLVDQDLGDAYISQHVGLVRLTAPSLVHYICRFLSPSSPGNEQIAGSQSGQSKPGLTLQNLRDFWIAQPPTLAEQEAIAEALSDADALIESLEQLIAKKRQIKQGAMQELLSGKKRLPGFSGEWQDTTVVENILRSFCGPSPTCEERNIDGSAEWGVLKTTAITWENGWDWTRHKTLPRSYWNQPNIELQEGDVLVTKAGPRHRVGVSAWIDFVPDQVIPSGKMVALRPNPSKAVPLMLSAAIAASDAQTYLDQRTTGMAESQVNFENLVLLETPIKLPSLAEQTAIAEVLSDMDGEITTLEYKLTKVWKVKQGMMQELLTGNIRLVKPAKSHA